MTRYTTQTKRLLLFFLSISVAGMAIGCGVGPDVPLPTRAKESVSHEQETTASEELSQTFTPTVKVSWRALALDGTLEMLAVWDDALLLLQTHEQRTQVLSVKEQDGEWQTKSLFQVDGRLLGVVTHEQQLLVLSANTERVELRLGTLDKEALTWRTIQTYAAAQHSTPHSLQAYSHEVLLFGRRVMMRYDWDSQRVIQLPYELPGDLAKASCHRDQCVAAIKGTLTPYRLLPSWTWEKLEVTRPQSEQQEDPKSPTSPGTQVDNTPRVVLRGHSLLYQVGQQVFFSCHLGRVALRSITVQDASVHWVGQSLGHMKTAQVLLQRGQKKAELALPTILSRKDKGTFALTQLQSLGRFILLRNSEDDTSYRRTHLSLSGDTLAADSVCE